MAARKKLEKERSVSTSPLIELATVAAKLEKERISQSKSKEVSQNDSKLVSSKIEHTPINTSTSSTVSKVEPALAYRTRIDELGADMFTYSVRITEGNMLNAKLALWEAIRRVEKVMREKGV